MAPLSFPLSLFAISALHSYPAVISPSFLLALWPLDDLVWRQLKNELQIDSLHSLWAGTLGTWILFKWDGSWRHVTQGHWWAYQTQGIKGWVRCKPGNTHIPTCDRKETLVWNEQMNVPYKPSGCQLCIEKKTSSILFKRTVERKLTFFLFYLGLVLFEFIQ